MAEAAALLSTGADGAALVQAGHDCRRADGIGPLEKTPQWCYEGQ